MTLLLALACSPEPLPSGEPPWVAVGDLRPDRAVIWAYTGDPAQLSVTVTTEGGQPVARQGPIRSELGERTLTLAVEGLPADTPLVLTVTAEREGRAPATQQARFTTPPLPESARELTVLVGGDLGGQDYCRPPQGYTIFQTMARQEPDLLLFNGDLIYADGECPERAPDGLANVMLEQGHPSSVADLELDWSDPIATRAAFDAWWAYHRADPSLRALLRQAPVVAQWDDHEVVNDFGASWERWPADPEREGFSTLVAQARASFFAWNPVEGAQIHRSFRWGRHLEVFVVDARSFRSDNAQPDGADKTLLGAEQLAWLQQGLLASDATWKLVSIDVPLTVPTGTRAWERGRDGVANGTGDAEAPHGAMDRSPETGFEGELTALLDALHAADTTGLLFVTTDVHFTQTSRLGWPAGHESPMLFHEVISGPLRAWTGAPGQVDPTLSPQVLHAAGGRPSFQRLSIDAGGGLVSEILGRDGEVLEGSRLELAPAR